MKTTKISEKEYKASLDIVKAYLSQLNPKLPSKVLLKFEGPPKFSEVTKNTPIRESGLSVRTFNGVLGTAYYGGFTITKVKDLAKLTYNGFLRSRGVGRRSLEELQDLCLSVGIILPRN